MPSVYYKNYKPNPAGTLDCGSSTADSVTLSYTYTNATTNLGIYRDQSLVGTISIDTSGSGSGEYTVSGLSPSTRHTYKLIHGNNINEQLLAEVQCSTQARSSGGGSSYYDSDDTDVYWIYLDPATHRPGYSISLQTYGHTRIHYYSNDTSRYPYLPNPPSHVPYGISTSGPWGSSPWGWNSGTYTISVTNPLGAPAWVAVSGANVHRTWPGYPY